MLLGGPQPLVTSSLRFENTASAWKKKKIDFYKPSKHFLLFFSPTEAWTRVCVGLSLWFIRAGGLGWCVYTGYTSLFFVCVHQINSIFFSPLFFSFSPYCWCVTTPPFLCSSPFSHTHTHTGSTVSRCVQRWCHGRPEALASYPSLSLQKTFITDEGARGGRAKRW